MAGQLSDDHQNVACEVDRHHHVVRLSGADPQGDLDDQRDQSVNSVIRKFTRNRKIYPNEESALKITFMAIREASKKWTMPIKNWKAALNHFAILYEDRLPTQSP